jgi:hypothetical protein
MEKESKRVCGNGVNRALIKGSDGVKKQENKGSKRELRSENER